jgi:homoserine dehydrogenase
MIANYAKVLILAAVAFAVNARINDVNVREILAPEL